MKTSTWFKTVVTLLLVAAPASGQLKFADSSGLSNADYVAHQIKDISDSDLFRSIRTGPALQRMMEAARHGQSEKAYEEWGIYWAHKKQPRYITQTDGFLLDTDMLRGYDQYRSYMAKHPAERDTILHTASMLLRNTFRTWGDVMIEFGAKVDFNRDVGQSGKYGFHYWWWSRPLIDAYVLTNDQKYLAKFDELFHEWYEQRNSITRGFPELDVVYYELGLGMRNRMFIEYYFLPYNNRSWKTHKRMLKSILAAGRWLYELERWEGYRPGNWQIHGSYMLAQIALVFPEFKEAKEWQRMALLRLGEHVREDFFEDGGHSERAPRNYTSATYLSYRNLYYLLQVYKAGGTLAEEIRQRMGNTIDWWLTMLAPTGEIPAINDSHRGLFPTSILLDGAEFFRKPYVYGVLKNLFGLTPKGSTVSLPQFCSRHMPASGFSVMRTDWTPRALYLNVNYGKWNGSHTHNDMLDFEIYAYGKALAVDAGLGLTYDDPLYIPWYRSSRAHNMVTVNDRDLERKSIEGENVIWSSDGSLDYFAAEHLGYANVGVRHRREIVFVKPRYWIVLDQLRCQNGGDTLSWFFHSPTTLVKNGLGYQSSTSPGILVLPAAGGGSSRTGFGAAASTHELKPGKTEQINWISFDQISTAASTINYFVLLFPYENSVPPVVCSSVSDSQLRVVGPGFSDDLCHSSAPLTTGGVATDAILVLIHHTPGHADEYSLVNGTYLDVGGKHIWQSKKRQSAEKIIAR